MSRSVTIAGAAEIRSENEAVAGYGIDAMRSPPAAYGGIGGGVVGGVVGDRDDQLPVLVWDLPEDFLLKKLGIHDGERPPALL